MSSVRVVNIPEDIEENEIEKYFRDNFKTNSKVISFSQLSGHPAAAVVVLEDKCVIEKVLESRHIIKGHGFTVLPEIFQEVQINDRWIKAMMENNENSTSFLKKVCQTQSIDVAVTSNNGKYWLVGDSESLLNALRALNMEYEKLFVGKWQGISDNVACQVDTRSSSSVQKNDDQMHSERSHPDVTNDRGKPSEHHASHITDGQEYVTSTPSEDQPQSGEFVKANVDGPQRNRRLKGSSDSNPVSSQVTDEQKRKRALKTTHDSRPTHVNKTGISLADKRTVTIPDDAKSFFFATPKSKYLLRYRKPDIDRILLSCSFAAVTEDGEDCQWYYVPFSAEQHERIEKDLTALTTDVKDWFEVVIAAAEFDATCINKIFEKNDNPFVSLSYDQESRFCTVHGFDKGHVFETKDWLQQMLQNKCREQLHSVDTKSKSCRLDFKIKSLSGDRLDIESRSNLSIHVYQGDMLRQQTEVIVNSANDQLAHAGGLARAILSAGGQEIDVESKKIIKERGKLSMGDVVHTTAGNLPPPVRFVIHAVPPNQYQMDTRNKDECSEALIKVFYHSMTYANDTLHAKSISLPPFGAGIFQVPVKVIIQAAYKALQQYDNFVERSKSSEITLKEIHFISNDLNVTREIITVFKSLMS